ncbi:MAG: arginine--tRNA ligase, partial [Candidatus Anstonellales archaeon]
MLTLKKKYEIGMLLHEILKNNFKLEIEQKEIFESISLGKLDFSDFTSNILFKVKAKNKGLDINYLGKELAAIINEYAKKNYIGIYCEFNRGYLNFFYNEYSFEELLHSEVNSKLSDISAFEKKETYVIEFPSVNPNKPWHIGHLRNALIGQTIANLLRTLGNNVIVIDYIDDLGLQFAQTIYGIENLKKHEFEKLLKERSSCIKKNDSEKLRENYELRIDFFMGLTYVEVNKLYPEDSKEIKEIVEKMENDYEFLLKTRKIAELCVSDQYLTSDLYGIQRDLIVFESDIIRFVVKNGIKILSENKLLEYVNDPNNKYYKCYVIDVSSFKESKEPKKVLIRSNGTLTYLGKDLIFHLWKYGILSDNMKYSLFGFGNKKIPMTCFYVNDDNKIKFERTKTDIGIVVIGNEQKFPQKIISHALKSLGYSVRHVHISYAHVKLKESQFSGRKGTWIGYTAEDLFEECVKRELELIKNNYSLSDNEKLNIAKIISLAAIKYYILKYDNDKEILFDWDNALSLKGNSGPYVLYSLVRSKSILKKSHDFEINGRKNINIPNNVKTILDYACSKEFTEKWGIDAERIGVFGHSLGGWAN